MESASFKKSFVMKSSGIIEVIITPFLEKLQQFKITAADYNHIMLSN